MEEPESLDPIPKPAHIPPQRRRWSLLVATVVVAAAAGFYSARAFRWAAAAHGPSDPATMEAANPQTEAAADGDSSAPGSRTRPGTRKSQIDPAASVPDPSWPIPASPQGLNEEASRFLDHLVDTMAGNPDALELKARHLEWFGKSKQALECWEQCLKLDPNYAYAYVGMGNAAASRDDHRKAAELLRKAVQLAPGNFAARIALAEALIASNQPKETVAVLEDYVKRDPRSQGFFLLGQAYVQLEQFEKARENLEAAIQKYPEYGDAYYRLSNVYTRLGQQDKARQCIQKSRELKAKQRQDERVQKKQYDDLNTVRARIAETYASAAGIYFVQNRHLEAERLWRRAALLAPTNVECRQGLAWLLRQQVRIPEEISILEQLAALQPKNPEIWHEIGQMHADLTEFAEAERAMARAVELAPTSPRHRAAYEAIKKTRAERARQEGDAEKEKK